MGWTTTAGPHLCCPLLDPQAGKESMSLEKEKPIPSPER